MLTFALQLSELLEKGGLKIVRSGSLILICAPLLLINWVSCTERNINAVKQNGFGMARDLQLSTANWGSELSDVPPGYHGPWQGGEDWVDLVHLHELPGEGQLSLSATMTRDRDVFSALFGPMHQPSSAKPIPLTLKKERQESTELLDNAMKAVRFCWVQ